MNWFKIRVERGKDSTSMVGSSPHSMETLVEQATQGKYIQLHDLLYMDRGEMKDWETWDKRDVPTVVINPEMIISIMQYKADPRTLSRS